MVVKLQSTCVLVGMYHLPVRYDTGIDCSYRNDNCPTITVSTAPFNILNYINGN